MDFTINRDELLSVIDKCQLATDKNHVTEAFRSMTVDASKKKSVRFAAVGEFCSVDTVAVAEVKSTGAFNVMPGRLRDIASSMPQGRVQFTLKGTRVTVKSLVSSRKASFENHTIDPFRVDDPGSGAAWKEVDSHELMRALRVVKAAAVWDGNDNPVESLLIPTERGVDVYGCNGYLISLCETSLRFEGENEVMRLPQKAVDVLALMSTTDSRVRLFADQSRVYLENEDTLVSALLWANNSNIALHAHMIPILKNQDNIPGPTFRTQQLAQGLKSVLALSGFADSKNKGARGFQVHAVLGTDTCMVELAFSEADARDEFDVEQSGAELEFYLSSKFFDQMLSSLNGYESVQALRADNLLILRSQGVFYGIMEEHKI